MFEPNDLKLRPIVASPMYPMRKLSQLIDILLKPFLKQLKAFFAIVWIFSINVQEM